MVMMVTVAVVAVVGVLTRRRVIGRNAVLFAREEMGIWGSEGVTAFRCSTTCATTSTARWSPFVARSSDQVLVQQL